MDRHVEWMCKGDVIRGMFTDPPSPSPNLAIFLHGWAGDRTGPHRIFYDTARSLADRGWASLRFDFRGRGDSGGRTEDASIRSMTDDAVAAISLAAEKGFRRIALIGICSGCKAAICAAAMKPEIRDLVLWSAEAMGGLRPPDARLRKGLAALRTYIKKLAAADSWRKILRGQVNTRMVSKAILASESPDRAEKAWEAEMLQRFSSFNGRILFIYGSCDPERNISGVHYARFCERRRISACFHTVQGATHSFYSLSWKREVIGQSVDWLAGNSAHTA